MNFDEKKSSEERPLFPSGEWVGFYVYPNNPERHKMIFTLEFSNGIINGTGSDDVGGFSFKGKYDLENMRCYMMKHYSTHMIDYDGYVDENGIWGKWKCVKDASMSNIPDHVFNMLMSIESAMMTGGFHIWPKERKFSAAEVAEKEIASKKVLELVK